MSNLIKHAETELKLFEPAKEEQLEELRKYYDFEITLKGEEEQ